MKYFEIYQLKISPFKVDKIYLCIKQIKRGAKSAEMKAIYLFWRYLFVSRLNWYFSQHNWDDIDKAINHGGEIILEKAIC